MGKAEEETMASTKPMSETMAKAQVLAEAWGDIPDVMDASSESSFNFTGYNEDPSKLIDFSD